MVINGNGSDGNFLGLEYELQTKLTLGIKLQFTQKVREYFDNNVTGKRSDEEFTEGELNEAMQFIKNKLSYDVQALYLIADIAFIPIGHNRLLSDVIAKEEIPEGEELEIMEGVIFFSTIAAKVMPVTKATQSSTSSKSQHNGRSHRTKISTI